MGEMKMFTRYKCKKTNVSLRNINIVCRMNKWYEGNEDTDGDFYYIIGESGLTHSIDKKLFPKYFYTIPELREIEINKILD
jgi:hypothetical protein